MKIKENHSQHHYPNKYSTVLAKCSTHCPFVNIILYL